MDARGPFTSAPRSVGLGAALALAVGLGIPGPGQAQIVRDGTVGPAGPLAGPNYTIPHTDGTRVGSNLFHSFGRFHIGTNESATFTGPSEISHVISRVTGGERSTIDGLLRSQVGRADFWFLNPAGVLFGPQARLDVPAAFHVSTADEVRFADGARFSASDPAASRLSVAPPETFGFLRPNPAGIDITRNRLETKAGQTLSVVGGELQVTGGTLVSEGGQVNLTAMAGPGTVQAATGMPMPSAPARGTVRLADRARVDTSGDGGGRIALRGGQITIIAGSNVVAENKGLRHATGGIEVNGDSVRVASGSIGSAARDRGQAGSVAVTGRNITVEDGGTISSATFAQGKAGEVAIQADQLLVSGKEGALTGIYSDAKGGSGNAGDVTVTVPGRLEVSNGGLINSNTFTQGNAGQVTIHAETGSVTVRNGGLISSATYGQGQAGTVTVQTDQLVIAGNDGLTFNGITRPSQTGPQTGISTNADSGSTGKAGAVEVTGRDIAVRNGGLISSTTSGQGSAGQVTIDKTGSLTVSNGGQISSATYGQGQAGKITVEADRLLVSGKEGALTGIYSDAKPGSTGPAGAVEVTGRDIEVSNWGLINSYTFPGTQGNAGQVTIHAETGSVTVRNDGLISSASSGQGQGGTVRIHADRLLVSGEEAPTGTFTGISSEATQADAGQITIKAKDSLTMTGSSITTEAKQGGGGRITLTVGRLAELINSEITSSVWGGLSSSKAGDITIDPRFVVLDRSRIEADAKSGGRNGNIQIIADIFIRSSASVVAATGELAVSGMIQPSDIITPLNIKYLDATSLLPTACAARLGESKGSLRTVVHAAILPIDPDRPLLPSSLSYTGHPPPDRVAPSGGGEAGTQDAAPGAVLDPVPAGAGRLSFACGI